MSSDTFAEATNPGRHATDGGVTDEGHGGQATTDLLPSWDGPQGGSGCTNPDCPATGRWCRVLHVDEIPDVYPPSERGGNFPWPITGKVTHCCTRCGKLYSGTSDAYDRWYARNAAPWYSPDATVSEPVARPAEIGWMYRDEYSIRTNAERAVERLMACCEPTTAEVEDFIFRFVRGAGPELARSILDERGADE